MDKLSEDTEVILLLCCRLPADIAGSELAKPLTHQEYVSLASCLLNKGLRPSDLLGQRFSQQIGVLERADFDVKRLQNLLARGVSLSLAVERWERAGIWILSRADAAYPKRWKKVLGNRAPAILFGAGNPMALNEGGLGVVGSRNISHEVEGLVSRVATMAAQQGVNVVSGGARGVDTIAMRSASQAGGNVVGVLADGLAKSIAIKGNRNAVARGSLTLVSPFTPEVGFNVGNAMGRNKLIYASSDAVLVAQVDLEKGGTWSGAVECLNNSWTPVLVQNEYPSEGLGGLLEKGAERFDLSENGNISEYIQALLPSDAKTASQPQLI